MPSGKSNKKKGTANSIDAYIGGQIRKIRLMRGMTLTELAKGVGVQFQQMQKYEDGVNRTSGSRLVMIAEALECSPAELLGKYAGNEVISGKLTNRDFSIIRMYRKMPAEIQDNIYKLLKAMCKLELKAN